MNGLTISKITLAIVERIDRMGAKFLLLEQREKPLSRRVMIIV